MVWIDGAAGLWALAKYDPPTPLTHIPHSPKPRSSCIRGLWNILQGPAIASAPVCTASLPNARPDAEIKCELRDPHWFTSPRRGHVVTSSVNSSPRVRKQFGICNTPSAHQMVSASPPASFSPATAAAIASESQLNQPRTIVESPTPLSAHSSGSGRSPPSSAVGSEPFLGTPRSKLSQSSLADSGSADPASSGSQASKAEMTDSTESQTRRRDTGTHSSEIHPSPYGDDEEEGQKTSGFKIGFAEDRNKKHRRTMEVRNSCVMG